MKLCQVIDTYLKLKDRTVNDYALFTKFQNIQGMMVEFRTSEFADYVKELGIPYIAKQ